MTTIELKRGVKLCVINTDKFKNDILTVNLITPLRKETASAYSVLTDVLMRGTVNYPTMRELNIRQDELYSLGLEAGAYKKGETQVVSFNISALNDNFAFDGTKILEEGMKLLSELIFCPYTENGKFSKEYLQSEKKNLCDEIDAQINNKNAYARFRCTELMCENEAYSVSAIGEKDAVNALTCDELMKHYNTLLNTAPVIILYVGSKTAQEVAELCKKELKFGERDEQIPKTQVIRIANKQKTISEKMKVNQCKLSVGCRMGITLSDDDYIVFALFNELFSGSPSSKLFMNVREKKSLCYYCYSVPDAIKGVAVIASGIEQKNKQIALDAIINELNALKNGEISDDEMLAAKKSLANGYREIEDSASSISNWYFTRLIAGKQDSPADAAKALEKITKADVVRIASGMVPETVYYLEGEEK